MPAVDSAQIFASRERAPYAATWDRERHFPLVATRRAAEQNYLSLYIDEADGGLGLSRLSAALIFEQLAAGCDAIAAYLTIHNRACWILARFAGDALKTIWLPGMIAGELPASYCLTEPGAGSDATHLRTRARRDGDVYVLQGSKCFISGAGSTDVLIVMARTGEDGAKGISCFGTSRCRRHPLRTSRWPSSKPCSSSSPTCSPSSPPAGRWHCWPPTDWTAAIRRLAFTVRWPSASPPTRASRSATRPCNSTAAMAT